MLRQTEGGDLTSEFSCPHGVESLNDGWDLIINLRFLSPEMPPCARHAVNVARAHTHTHVLYITANLFLKQPIVPWLMTPYTINPLTWTQEMSAVFTHGAVVVCRRRAHYRAARRPHLSILMWGERKKWSGQRASFARVHYIHITRWLRSKMKKMAKPSPD